MDRVDAISMPAFALVELANLFVHIALAMLEIIVLSCATNVTIYRTIHTTNYLVKEVTKPISN